MMALVGVAPLDFPAIDYNVDGTLVYNSASDQLTIDATPFLFMESLSDVDPGIFFNGDLKINIQVDSTGALVGGVSGPDFIITGDVDVDGDFVVDFSGTLLTGEISQFGFLDTGTNVDAYDFRFNSLGGALASFYEFKDLGVTTTSENSTFAGSFTVDFLGKTKGQVGAINPPVTAEFASLGGKKFDDKKGDGPSVDDTPLAGVTINLYVDTNGNGQLEDAEDDAPLATQQTADDGSYLFLGLLPGDYIVKEVVPGGSVAIGVDTYAVTLEDGDHLDTDFDFYNTALASLGGEKYIDVLDDGPTADDTPLAGVTINLYRDNGGTAGSYDAGDTLIGTKVTGGNGAYLFTGLLPGNYIVKEVVPSGSTPIGLGEFAVVLVSGSHFDHDYDFYNVLERGSISGHKTLEFIECKCDKYGNPIQTLVTQSHAGVTIKLYADDGDGVFDAGDTLAGTEVTDGSGNYSFDDLAPGLYFVQEVVADGYVALTPAVVAANVAAGADVTGINFKNKLVKGSIGNYFFIDYNSNGIQDAGDEGVNGVTVKLLDKLGSVIATTVTASDGSGNAGYYLFYNLDAGQYFVEFVVPTGVSFTTKDVSGNANDALDSDVNSNGRTDLITLGSNQHIRTVDAGVKGEVCVENIVYKVKDYFDKCQQSKAGTIKGVTLEYNDGTDELFVQVTVASYNGRIADGFTIVIDDGSDIGDKAGTHAVFYFDATGANPILNVLAYNGDQNGTSIRDSNGNTNTYDPDRVATSLNNASGWVKELTATGNSSKKVFTFRVDVGAINDHVPLRNINWQGSEIGKYASFLVDTFDGLTTKYDANGFLTKWSFCYHGWMDACQIKTQKCTVKECIAIDEFFSEWGWETSAFTGNSNGDPLADWDWDGSVAASCKCDDDRDPCKPRKDNDCDDKHWDDWDCFKDFGRKLSGRC